MHGGTLPRWLKGKEMKKNLKGEEKVDPRQNDNYIIGKIGWNWGKEENFRAYPGRCRASGTIGENKRGLGRRR